MYTYILTQVMLLPPQFMHKRSCTKLTHTKTSSCTQDRLHTYVNYMYMRISANYNCLGCEQTSGVDINHLPNAQDAFQPIPGLFASAGALGTLSSHYSKDYSTCAPQLNSI